MLKMHRLHCLGLVFFGSLAALAAQTEKKDTAIGSSGAEWLTKTFQISFETHSTARSAEMADHWNLPNLPGIKDGADIWSRHIQLCTSMVGKELESCLGPLPQGTAILYDPATATLAVRTTAGAMASIEVWGNYLETFKGWDPVFHLHVVEAAEEVMREIVDETAASKSYRSAWQRLSVLVDQGDAKMMASLCVPARSGTRVKAHAGGTLQTPAGITWHDAGWMQVREEARQTGLSLELEPTVGTDAIDATYSFTYDFAPPVYREANLPWSRLQYGLTAPMTDFHRIKAISSFSTYPTEPRLIAIWKPAPDRGKVMQGAFLISERSFHLPGRNEDLAALLTQFAGPPPAPEGGGRAKAWPAGMQLRLFRAPTNFLDASPGGLDLPPSRDPSSPGRQEDLNPPAFSDWPLLRSPELVKRSLEKWSILFPEGAFASFHTPTSTVLMVNTPENLDQLGALLTSSDCGRPQSLILILHIIQADGPALRRMMEEARKDASTSALWQLVRAKLTVPGSGGKHLETVRMETRSGTRVHFEAGTARTRLGELRHGRPPGYAESTDADLKEDAGNGTAAATRFSEALQLHTADYETTLAGLRFEADPVVTASGELVDINFALDYHYALPTERNPPPSPAPTPRLTGALAPLPSSVEFHAATLLGSVSLPRGTTLLIGTWRPLGAPEFDGKDLMQAAFLRVEPVFLDVPQK